MDNIFLISNLLKAKVISVENALSFRESFPQENMPLVFTNGVFDILHKGHISYLAQAKSLGKKLIVGLNSDSSVKMLGKGDDRPINNQDDRLIMLASLCMVDYVILFYEKTPIRVIQDLKPHIYVKGGDYTLESLPETPIVQSWGGEVKILQFVDGYSTTNFLQKVRN